MSLICKMEMISLGGKGCFNNNVSGMGMGFINVQCHLASLCGLLPHYHLVLFQLPPPSCC